MRPFVCLFFIWYWNFNGETNIGKCSWTHEIHCWSASMLQSVNPGPGDPLGNLASTETRTELMFESANPGPGDPLGNLASTATWLDSRPDNGWRWLSDACNAGGWNALFVVASSWRTHSLRASKSYVVSSRWWNKGRYEWNVVGFARVHTTEK